MSFLELLLDRFERRVSGMIEMKFFCEAEIRLAWVDLAIERMALEALQ